MIPQIIKILIDGFIKLRERSQRKRIEQLEAQLNEAEEVARYRDYVRRVNDERRMR